MPRFTFSQRLGSKPSEASYNSIRDDFRAYINSDKLTSDNLSDESIRFRHLKKPPVILMFKDCGNAIWSRGAVSGLGTGGAGWTLYRDTPSESDNTLEIEYSIDGDEPGVDLVEFTIWYYPYSFSSNSEVAPAVYRSGAWVPLVDYRRPAGIGIGFQADGEQRPYTSNPSDGLVFHPFLPYSSTLSKTGVGSYDRPHTASYGGPVICTVLLSKQDLANVTKLGMMFNLNASKNRVYSADLSYGLHVTQTSRYDRLYLSVVARDN